MFDGSSRQSTVDDAVGWREDMTESYTMASLANGVLRYR